MSQRELLLRYAKDHGYTNTKVLIDDGYTSRNFNRPGVQEGFELVKQGFVGYEELELFAGLPIFAVICGRSIRDATDPGAEVQRMKGRIDQLWG